MNAYEITFIIRPDLDEEQTRGVAEQVANRIRSADGEVLAMYPWSPARRRMAFPIRDYGDGFYATATFRIDAQAIRDIENTLKLNESILRFLVVQASDLMVKNAQQRVQQQAAAAAPPPPAPPGGPMPAPQGGPEAQPVPQGDRASEAVPVSQEAPVEPSRTEAVTSAVPAQATPPQPEPVAAPATLAEE